MNLHLRESKMYLSFFKRNLTVLSLSILAGLFFSFIYISRLPRVFILSQLFEMQYTDGNVLERAALADQAVTVLRSDNLKKSLGISDINFTVFKPGPLAIKFEYFSTDKNKLTDSVKLSEDYLTGKFPVHKTGEDLLFERSENKVIFFLIGIALGFSFGLVVSLTTEYFKKF